MKRSACAAALALAVAACSHATKVEKPDQGGSGSGQQAQPTKSQGGAAEQPKAARRPQRPGRPPLAASPSGLLVPGGVEQIQKALASHGYLDLDDAEGGQIDAATAGALRKFQADEGIARTGSPDHETVRRLGLDPDQLFRKSEPKQDER